MTTVAYDGKTIAYDSRSTQGGTIMSDQSEKGCRTEGNYYFVACSPSDHRPFIDAHLGKAKLPDHYVASAFIVKPDGVYLSGTTEGDIWEIALDHEYAIGSGADHAMTAMDMGASAKEAVQWAAQRDTNTGGKIRTFKVS